MKMKVNKLLGLLLAVMLLVSLSACGTTNQQPETLSQESNASQTENGSSETVQEAEDETAVQTASDGADTSETASEEEIPPSAQEQTDDGTVQETAMQNESDIQEDYVMKMNVQVGDTVFLATLEENEAVSAFVEMMKTEPVIISMSDYSGFEKVGPLGTSLPASNSQTTTNAGDIVLYNGNQIVIFYGSNSWSYTRLGHIDDLTGWEEALGSGDVTVTFSLE